MNCKIWGVFKCKSYPILLPDKGFFIDYGTERIISELQSTGIPRFSCFPLLCFADIVGFGGFFVVFFFFFYNLKICGNPALSKSISTIFPMAFAHFLYLCHILVILEIFQTFSLLCLFCDLLSAIFDVTIVIVWRYQEVLPWKTAILIGTCCGLSDCSTNQLFPVSPLLLGPLMP